MKAKNPIASILAWAWLAGSPIMAANGPGKVELVPNGLQNLSLASQGPFAQLTAIQSHPIQALQRLKVSQAIADVALYKVLSHPEAIAQNAEALVAVIGPDNFQALTATAKNLEQLAAQNNEVKNLLSSGGDPAAALENFKKHFDGAAHQVPILDAADAVSVPAGFSEGRPRSSGLKPARPTAEPHVVVAANSDVAQALATFGKRPVDPATLPSTVRPRIERLIRESGGFLDSMLKPEDGAGKIHVVLLDDMKPTAVTTHLGNGEKIIGLNIGIFNVIENDAELAYVFAQQLEHSKSQLASQAAELKAKGMIEGDFLERTSSNEVDIRAVQRLIDAGISPHAAVDYLNRLRSKVGEVLEPRTSSLLTTRVNGVGGAIALLVRGKGGNEEHRLDSLPRPRKVTDGAAESLRSAAFREHLAARTEALLRADGAGEPVYEKVKEGVFFGVGTGVGLPGENAFAQDYRRIWREIESLQLEPIPARQAIDLQMKLIKNLDAAYARSRAKVLGATFRAENAYQISSLLKAEKRTYSLSAPNLFGAAHELFEIETELEGLEAKALKPGDAAYETWQRETQLVRQRHAEARDKYELAKYPYEAEDGLDAKLRAVHEKDDRRLEDWSHDDEWGDSRRASPMLDRLNLRLREIQGLFTGERERLKEVKKTVREPKLDPAQPLYSFLANGINPMDRDDHTVEEYKAIFDTLKSVLEREFGPGGEAEVRARGLGYLTHDRTGGMLRAFFWRYHALEPADTDARLREVLELIVDHDWKSEQLAGLKEYLDGFDRLLTPATKESVSLKIQMKSAEGMADEVKSARTVDEVFAHARKLQQSLHDDRSPRGRDGIRLPSMARRKLLDALAERLAAASRSGLGSARAKNLIQILAPSLEDSSMTQDDYDRIGADLEAIAADSRQAQEFTGRIGFDELAHALVDRPYPEYEHRDFQTDEEFAARDKRQAERYASYHAEVDAGISGFWNLLKKVHGFIRFADDGGQPSYLFVNSRDVVGHLLGKIGDERPFDFILARRIFSAGQGADAWKPMLEFMNKSFLAHLKKYPNVAAATFQFWKSVDDAGIAPTYHDMNGISEVIKAWNPGVTKTKIGDREYLHLSPEGVAFFNQYLEGVTRFADHARTNGRKAVYSPQNRAKEDPRLEEIDHRANFEHISTTLSTPELRKQYKVRQLADLYLRLLDTGHAPYPSAEHDKIFEALWAAKEGEPVIQKLLTDPRVVERLFYHSNQMKLAQWQLSRIPGYDSYLADYKAGRAKLPSKSGVRPVVEKAHDLVKQQFRELSPARNEIIGQVEKKLLTNEAETKLLGDSRINKTNWTQAGFLNMVDAPAIVNKGLRDNYERLQTIRYLIGMETEAPELLDRKSFLELDSERLRAFHRSYAENGTAFRTLTLLPLLDEKQGLLADPKSEAEVLKIVIGSHYDNTELRILAETYLAVLPPSEKKALLAAILSGYDPNSRSTGSLKRLLTAGGPLGAKGAQGLLTSGIIDAKTRAEFLEFFDDFMKPGREQVFKHLQDIFGDRLVYMEGLGEIPGSGSLNYVAKLALKDPATGKTETVVVRVQKDDVPSLIRNENKVWLDVYARLKAHPNARVRRLARLIEEVREQSFSTLGEHGAELDLEQEVARHGEAANAYDNSKPDAKTGFTVEAVRPNLGWQRRISDKWKKRVAVYEAIDAVRLEDVSDPKLRAALARQIIRAEHKARAGGTFDPDGHLRNWLIDRKHKRLVRIDTAQLVGPKEISSDDILLFNQLLSGLMGVRASDRGGLMQLLRRHIGDIFAQQEHPADLDKVIARVVADRRLPPATAPIERLLFIQDAFETHYQGYGGQGLSFPLSRAIKLQLSAEMRVGMFRLWAGSIAYLSDLADTTGAGRVALAAAQVRSFWEVGLANLGRRFQSVFKPKSQ